MSVLLALQAQTPTPTPLPTTTDPRTIQAWLSTAWPDLLRAVLVVLAAVVISRLVQNWASSAMRRGRVDSGTQILVRRGLTIVIIVTTILIVLGILGADPAGLVTFVAAIGLAFSLAVQDILKNFFAGVYLLIERPFRVGDSIKVKDQLGVVEHIGVRTTMLRTEDNVHILVPNAIVFAEVVANHTQQRPAPPATPDENKQSKEPDAARRSA